MAKAGWHTIKGYDIHVSSDGFVDYAIKVNLMICDYEAAHFYVPCKYGGWEYWSMKRNPLTLKQFKDRVYRGTMIVF